MIKKNMSKQRRKQIVATLTDVYRAEAQLYLGIADLIRSLIAAPDIVVGLVTRNITNEPPETLRQLFTRHDIDTGELDFLVHIPLIKAGIPCDGSRHPGLTFAGSRRHGQNAYHSSSLAPAVKIQYSTGAQHTQFVCQETWFW